MKLVLLDPVTRDPITEQGKVGDPILPVLQNAKGDRLHILVVGTSAGQKTYGMQADPFVAHGNMDLEGAYPFGSGQQGDAGPITVAVAGTATFTILAVRGAIKEGQAQTPKVVATEALDIIA